MTTPTPRGRAKTEAERPADPAAPAVPKGQPEPPQAGSPVAGDAPQAAPSPAEPPRRRRERHKYDVDSLRVVAFTVAGREYVADVAQVQEIVRLSDLQQMDNAPEYVEGLLTRRGRLVPVIDMRKRLHVDVGPQTFETCVIVARLSVGPTGFIADSASDLRWVKTSAFEVPSPLMASAGQDHVRGVADIDGHLVVLLDLGRLLAPSERVLLDKVVGSGLAVSGETRAETLYAGETATDSAQGAQSARRLRRVVSFGSGGETYGIPIDDVSEISLPLRVARLPHVPAHVAGLVNLRGVMMPVVDLARVMGLPPKEDALACRLVVVKGNGYQVALMVDEVHGLVRLEESAFRPAPANVARGDPELLDKVAALEDGRMVVVINMRRLLEKTAAARESPAA